jgi:hypothetical protein
VAEIVGEAGEVRIVRRRIRFEERIELTGAARLPVLLDPTGGPDEGELAGARRLRMRETVGGEPGESVGGEFAGDPGSPTGECERGAAAAGQGGSPSTAS